MDHAFVARDAACFGYLVSHTKTPTFILVGLLLRLPITFVPKHENIHTNIQGEPHDHRRLRQTQDATTRAEGSAEVASGRLLRAMLFPYGARQRRRKSVGPHIAKKKTRAKWIWLHTPRRLGGLAAADRLVLCVLEARHWFPRSPALRTLGASKPSRAMYFSVLLALPSPPSKGPARARLSFQLGCKENANRIAWNTL